MINQIRMEGVASFKQAALLETDKKVNLIYGLNGVGKSTVGNYFYSPNDSCFSRCSHSNSQQLPILVYNQKFIHDNFFVQDSLRGIFSLSKENKEAESKITQATNLKNQLNKNLEEKNAEKEQLKNSFEQCKQQSVNKIWEIKGQYSGGDRVLEYCLEGMMGKKEKLFDYINKITKPIDKPQRSLEEIKKEVESFKDDTSVELSYLTKIQFNQENIENDPLFSMAIMGNSDSEVATMIERLGNADWVKQGVQYLDGNNSSSNTKCPFCQKETITSHFISHINDYFDKSYQENMSKLEKNKKEYQLALENIPTLVELKKHSFSENYISEITNAYNDFYNITKNNLNKIEEKIKSPKVPQLLVSSEQAIQTLNQVLEKINQDVESYNNKLKNKQETLCHLKNEFWSIMRWQYDQTLSRFDQDKKTYESKTNILDQEISSIRENIKTEEEKIITAQRETINIDEAIDAINKGLQEIGIDSFKITKHSNNLYKIVRENSPEDVFHSLSEGEKMMISFLYFCELCKGKTGIQDSGSNKIIIIDDPISSLSHIFVFNIGRLIKNLFFKEERFSQVFVLTHSLYFFYELTETNHEKRKKEQKLFRISKSPNGSCINPMKYEEIQNDYQAYWNVINDKEQPPALIANCMRNIIEYFFSFVDKKALGNVFQMPELQEVHLQAFYRYINRESHSIGQNLIDMKEFDYDNFKEGLRLVFEKTGYSAHFEAMAIR